MAKKKAAKAAKKKGGKVVKGAKFGKARGAAARASKASKRPSRPARPRTPRPEPLPGMEDVFIREIDNAARSYVDIKDERVALTAKEIPAKQKLIDAMHKHELKVYRHGDLQVVLTVEKEKIKVKLKDDNAGADDDDQDDDAGDDGEGGVETGFGGGDDEPIEEE